MNKLQEIRDALECAAHNSDDTNEMAYYYNTITTLDALMETHALVPISPNKKAFKILWNINNFNSIDECCTFYETLIAAAQEKKDE